jgi:acid phosphatase type 7
MRRLARPATAATAAVLCTLGSLGGSSAAAPPRDPHARATTRASTAAAAAPGRVVVVAVGDISCPPGAPRTRTTCHDRGTARLTSRIDPDAVLALGDLQYPTGSLRDFRREYATTWGNLRGRTFPVPGNHEYDTYGASGYYQYFAARQPGAPGYYAFDLGRWRVYALNTNCNDIDCAPEYAWLEGDLASHPRTCSRFFMHHPRFSSGREHGSDPSMSRFFGIAQVHDVDLVIAGHEHSYERFRRKRANGRVHRSGVMSFVSGGGGKSLHPMGRPEPGSAYRLSGHFGVLRLALRSGEFGFAFKDVDGRTRDKGERRCR